MDGGEKKMDHSTLTEEDDDRLKIDDNVTHDLPVAPLDLSTAHNLSKLAQNWLSFSEFETFSSDCDTSMPFAEFLVIWEEKLRKATEAGCQYSDSILAFKLLGTRSLPQSDMIVLLGEVEDMHIDDQQSPSSLLDRVKKLLLQQESQCVEIAGVADDSYPSQMDQQDIVCVEGEQENEEETGFANSVDEQLSDIPMRGGRYACNVCEYTTRRLGDVKKHIKSVHIKLRRFACDQCSYRAKESGTLRKHKETVHDNIRRFQCDDCDYKCSALSDLRKHRVSRHEQLEHNCDLCAFSAPTGYGLKMHRLQVHGGVGYKCSVCTFEARTPSKLKMHERSVHQGRVYACSLCNYMAGNLGAVTKHIQSQHPVLVPPNTTTGT